MIKPKLFGARWRLEAYNAVRARAVEAGTKPGVPLLVNGRKVRFERKP